MVVVGIIMLVAFVGFAYFVTYKPWTFVFNVPEYSKYEKSWSDQKSLKEIVGFMFLVCQLYSSIYAKDRSV